MRARLRSAVGWRPDHLFARRRLARGDDCRNYPHIRHRPAFRQQQIVTTACSCLRIYVWFSISVKFYEPRIPTVDRPVLPFAFCRRPLSSSQFVAPKSAILSSLRARFDGVGVGDRRGLVRLSPARSQGELAMSIKAPNPVDKYVGSRVRMRRIMLGMSQEKLGEALGLTFQQIQKYEKGTNRVGASRIQQISEILQVPVSFLFEGGPSGAAGTDGFSEGASPTYVSDFLATSEGLALTRAFTRITDAKLRRSIVDLVEQIAARETPEKR